MLELYFFPRLNGGSAKHKSTDPDSTESRSARQSDSYNFPRSVCNMGIIVLILPFLLPECKSEEEALSATARGSDLPPWARNVAPALHSTQNWTASLFYQLAFLFVFSNPNAIAASRTSMFISFRVLNRMQYPVTTPRLLAYVSAMYFLSSRAEDINGDPGFAPRSGQSDRTLWLFGSRISWGQIHIYIRLLRFYADADDY